MSYPPAAIATNKANNTATSGDHPAHHNALASAVNDIVTELESRSVSVKSYGASGNGTADDTAAINSAISAVNAAGGGTVILTPGTYKVSLTDSVPIAGQQTAIVMRSGVTLRIERGATVKLAAAQTAPSGNGAIIRNVNAFSTAAFDTDMRVIGGGVIDGNAANNSSTSAHYHGIYFGTAERCGVEDVVVKNCRGNAAGTASASNLYETLHVTFYRCGNYWCRNVTALCDDGGDTATGLGSSFCTNGAFDSCTVHHMGFGAGITHYDSAYLTTTNCHSYLNGGHGYLAEFSQSLMFNSCVAGGDASDDEKSANKHAVFSWPNTLGNGTDTRFSYDGFHITSGKKITITDSIGAFQMSSKAGSTSGGAGLGIAGVCEDIVIDGCRFYSNDRGIDFTDGIGAASACKARMRQTLITPATLIGSNKGYDGWTSAENSIQASVNYLVISKGLMDTWWQGNAAGWNYPAASGVAVQNVWPFDVFVHITGGTISDVLITPGGPAPAAARSIGAQSTFTIPRGGSVTVNYTSTLTWDWFIP